MPPTPKIYQTFVLHYDYCQIKHRKKRGQIKTPPDTLVHDAERFAKKSRRYGCLSNDDNSSIMIESVQHCFITHSREVPSTHAIIEYFLETQESILTLMTFIFVEK